MGTSWEFEDIRRGGAEEGLKGMAELECHISLTKQVAHANYSFSRASHYK